MALTSITGLDGAMRHKAGLKFPYKPRRHQLEVARKIREYIRRYHIVLEAPTGFGKTPVVISALIPYLEKGYKVVWAVRTGNETDRPIEELKVFQEKVGLEVFAISYRGKKDMCLLAKRFGERLDYNEVSYICNRERRKCPYYKKFKEHMDPLLYSKKGALTYTEVFGISEENGICPYFAQRELLKIADIVSLSYNYVVSERFEWAIRKYFPYSEAILVVDEAHNLQNINLESDTITEGTMDRAMMEAQEMGDKSSYQLVEYVKEKVIEKYGHLGEDDADVFVPTELLPQGYFDLLDKAAKTGEQVRRLRYSQGKRPQSSLYHFSQFFLRALELEGTEGIAFIVEKPGERLHLNIWDMRSAEILSKRWRIFKRAIFISGTLEPIDAFAETIGLTNYIGLKVPSVYDEDNARVYLTLDLTTRGEELKPSMASSYVNAITRLLSRVRKNTAVFTASYRVQNRLMVAGLQEKARQLGYKVFEERRGMSGIEARQVLEDFKSLAEEGRGLLVAPMGGRFAEGADFPGEELMCIFLAGIPFEKPTMKTKLYIEYYQKLYGEEKGRLYAYVFPAIRRAAQALGRALRSPRDKAVIVLGDYRYKNYLRLLPDYVGELLKETVSEELDNIELPWE